MKNLILNKNSRRAIIGVLLLFGLIVSTYSLLAQNNKEKINNLSEKEELVIKTIKITAKDVGRDINLSGITQPVDEVAVSPKMSGKIVAFNVKEGDKVEAGQIIAQLEQDPVLLASYNNARAALINTTAAANQDISNAELAVRTAEINFTNTKINSEENVRNAELSVESAKVALVGAKKSLLNTQNSGKQSVENSYDNLRLTLQNNLVAIKNSLIAVGDILGEEPGSDSANNNYENVLGVKDSASLIQSKNLFFKTREEYEKVNSDYQFLNEQSSYEEIDVVADKINSVLGLTKNTLSETLVMLDNTITTSVFPYSSLSSLKSQISGQLAGINSAIDILSKVRQGVTTAKLAENSSGDNVNSAYESANKNLIKAEQGLVLAKRQAKTQIDAAEKQLESAQANLLSVKKRAELQISSAQAQVNSVNAQLANTRIAAPISGILNKILIETGEMAMAGKPLVTIINADSIKIELAITEFDIERVAVGQKVDIMLSAYPNHIFSGNVYYVGLVADKISKKFPIKVIIANEDKKIKAGMVAQVKIMTAEEKNILTVPRTAVFVEQDHQGVYVVDKDNRAQKVYIETKPLNDKEFLVESGLSAGDIVIANGNLEIKEGELIKINQK